MTSNPFAQFAPDPETAAKYRRLAEIIRANFKPSTVPPEVVAAVVRATRKGV